MQQVNPAMGGQYTGAHNMDSEGDCMQFKHQFYNLIVCVLLKMNQIYMLLG